MLAASVHCLPDNHWYCCIFIYCFLSIWGLLKVINKCRDIKCADHTMHQKISIYISLFGIHFVGNAREISVGKEIMFCTSFLDENVHNDHEVFRYRWWFTQSFNSYRLTGITPSYIFQLFFIYMYIKKKNHDFCLQT